MTPTAQVITQMQARRDAYLTQIKEIEFCIDHIQKSCDHQYEWAANTHNDDIHECVHCLFRIRI